MAILVLVILGSVASSFDLLAANVLLLGGIAIVFCVLSLTVGYVVPRLLKIDKSQAVASAFEVGIHNATLAIVIAQGVLQQPEMSLPAAVYGVLMFPIAALFGVWISRRPG